MQNTVRKDQNVSAEFHLTFLLSTYTVLRYAMLIRSLCHLTTVAERNLQTDWLRGHMNLFKHILRRLII